jgi:hypothetical protein
LINITGISRMSHINTWTVLKFLFRWSGKLIWYAIIVAGYTAFLVLDLLCAIFGGLTYMSIQADRASQASYRNSFNRSGH